MESKSNVAPKTKTNGGASHRAATQRAKISSSADPAELDLRELLSALHAMQGGDFSVRLPGSRVGVAGKVYDTFNTIVAANERMAQQLEHVGEVVGRQGKTRTRVR